MPSAKHWRLPNRDILLDRPVVLGIVNVTPDSFSDGGLHFDPTHAIEHARQLAGEGADIIDVGGESTRPLGAHVVPAEEEVRRVLPVVEALVRDGLVVSVDTNKAVVAEQVLQAGAAIINDVSAFRLDPELATVCAAHRAGVILMHSRGDVATMATFQHASYETDVTGDVIHELEQAVSAAEQSGISREAIVIDPGVGFAKRGEHSLRVLADLARVVELGFPVLVGVSRKRFIGELTGETEPLQRLFGTIGANVAALFNGAMLFRVHDVRAARQALDVAWAVRQATAHEAHA